MDREQAAETWDAVRKGETLEVFCLRSPTRDMIKLFREAQLLCSTSRHERVPRTVHWHYGVVHALECAKKIVGNMYGKCYYLTFPGLWDGYTDQSSVAILDYSPSWCSVLDLKQLISGLPCTRKTRDGYVRIAASVFFVFSNKRPRDILTEDERMALADSAIDIHRHDEFSYARDFGSGIY